VLVLCGDIANMKTVGRRELKDHLSEYLPRVLLGESVLVTDRSEVIAEFSPPNRGATDTSLQSACSPSPSLVLSESQCGSRSRGHCARNRHGA
jgi:antitoxin (DNA-binding transcriptional repressor) of toxin-antitoxin stability system